MDATRLSTAQRAEKGQQPERNRGTGTDDSLTGPTASWERTARAFEGRMLDAVVRAVTEPVLQGEPELVSSRDTLTTSP